MLSPQGFVKPTTTNVAATPEFQLVPHSIDAESALLGALAIDPAQMLECGYLDKSDFYLLNNGFLYEAMKDLFEKSQGYDLITLTEHLDTAGHLDDIGGMGAILDMINETPTSLGAPEYASIVYQYSISRQVIIRAQAAAEAAYKPVAGRSGGDLVNEVVSSFIEIDATRNVSGGPQPMRQGVERLLDKLKTIEQSGQVSGLQTGIKTLDHILGGFREKKFYLLAGRPGMGKSALAIQMAYNIAKRGIPVLFFALEMSQEDIAARLTSLVSGIPYESFNRPTNGNLHEIIIAADIVSRLPIIIDDTPALTVSQIRSRAQKIALSEPVGLIVIDHGGIARPERTTGNKYTDQSQIADGFMALPKQLDCPVLALLQLSRKLEERNDKRPMMYDLRDSGKWEENADGIMFLYRDEVYDKDTQFPHLGEINTAKNRGGKVGIAQVYALVATNRFVDLETRTVAI
jgi:replicative DNA helicase